MIRNIPNILTFSRILIVPVIIGLYIIRVDGLWLALIFIVTSFTDYLDGYLARRLKQTSKLGAFLDPVADKIMVTVVLILLVSDSFVLDASINSQAFIVVVTLIISREITVSALREWMAEIGQRSKVAVGTIGKLKTTSQMLAITLLLYAKDIGWFPTLKVGEVLLYIAGILTFYSMLVYLNTAWSNFKTSNPQK
ncbi:MAG: CDP-diacylglycerol--glycerol-3-phosphate 3-phosphatidyltransferase [Acidiferrobacteraceae bacterium]|nr:CDP-diacylglycerol--glycerol-3-phosphate 3-phosphatidyltransferase [Acidiferrobacteraceae bacterium]|tara:strand:+ start:1289 stop:1873 length:585 start_codon:yes stop_codon:yes gene_type:complete